MGRTRAFVPLFALALVLLFMTCAAHSQVRDVAFSKDEVIKIGWHGPWPPARRIALRPAAAALGERLFFDPRMSGTGSVLCATCHVPYRAFQDGRPLSFGLEEGNRNTPSLLNAGYFRRYGWDGARASLAAQSLRPLLEPKEMRSSAAHVASLLRSSYAEDYRRAFGRAPVGSDERLLEDAGLALAAYQETLVTPRTPFDEFRDVLAGADTAGPPAYPLAAQRGLKRFIAQCSTCHAGPLFSDGAIVRGFRVPSLRNVALTAPYMHDGSVASLADAVRHSDAALSPLDAGELAEFLKTLSATGAAK
jgi:cytochrome c peroxidase